MSRRSVRLLAIGGAVGPLTFVATWLTTGAVAKGYSPVEDAISDLAATASDTRVVMTLGFIAFGAGGSPHGRRQPLCGPRRRRCGCGH